jgi:copper chaperone CopZ
MTTKILSVPDISCEHCERAITNALRPINGVQSVSVDIPAKQVRVGYERGARQRRAFQGGSSGRGLPGRLGLREQVRKATKERYLMATTAKDPVCGMDVDPPSEVRETARARLGVVDRITRRNGQSFRVPPRFGPSRGRC